MARNTPCSVAPYSSWPRGDKIWVPIDDRHAVSFSVYYHRDRPLTDEERANFRAGLVNAPELERCAFHLPDGPTVDIWRPKHHRGRDYDIDREIQCTRTFTGIRAVADQDRAMVEGMGGIVDRSQEHLGTTAIAVITAPAAAADVPRVGGGYRAVRGAPRRSVQRACRRHHISRERLPQGARAGG